MESTIPNGKQSVVNAKLTGSSFSDVCLGEATFDDVNLSGAAFQNVNLSVARFDDVNLSKATISNANLNGTTINGIPVTELLAAYQRCDDLFRRVNQHQNDIADRFRQRRPCGDDFGQVGRNRSAFRSAPFRLLRFLRGIRSMFAALRAYYQILRS